MDQRIVGILGGMGPESTAQLFSKIIRSTPITKEQDHLRIVIDNNPKIPDRTELLLSGDTAPLVTALTETARNLELAGAEVIGMPCNTAHAFLAEIRASVHVPVVDMVEEAAVSARNTFGVDTVVGLLATDGTLATRLYHRPLDRHGLRVVAPRAAAQRVVTEVVDAVKRHGVSNESALNLAPAVEDVADQGASALIAACTEISLAFEGQTVQLPWLDPLQVLAEALVREATS